MLKLWLQLWTKRGHWQSCDLGGSYILMKCDVFRQNAVFLKEWSCISLKNASAGWDNIPTFVVRKVSKHIIKPLTYLKNKSIEQDIFPDELKVAKVFPIYKSGDKKCIFNYRPISVLTSFYKVFEKVMYNHLIDFIDDNNILCKHQFGFRKKS